MSTCTIPGHLPILSPRAAHRQVPSLTPFHIRSSNNDKLNTRSAEPSSRSGKEEAGDRTLAGQAGSTSKSEYTKPWKGGTEDFMTSRNEIDRISVSEEYRKMTDNMRKVAGKDGGDGGKKK